MKTELWVKTANSEWVAADDYPELVLKEAAKIIDAEFQGFNATARRLELLAEALDKRPSERPTSYYTDTNGTTHLSNCACNNPPYSHVHVPDSEGDAVSHVHLDRPCYCEDN